MRARSFSLVAALALAASGLAPTPARAGGFYLLDRGTRPMGRGGAFVAGADDPGALWYNPAGLGLAGEQFLLDATLTPLQISYTRIDSGGNTQPGVNGQSQPLPIPTIGGTFDFGLEHFTFGVGVFAPNAALLQWPEELTVDGAPYPAPQRYSLLSMEGSLIASLALGAAWTPIDELSIGLGVHVVFGSFAARVALSACDGTICTFPEDPDYDGVAQLTLSPVVTAIGTLGVTWTPGPVRIGASIMTPFSFSGTASIDVRPPAAAAFETAFTRSRHGDCASVSDEEVGGDPNHPCRRTTADVNLNFPVIVRLGIELLAVENLRLELAVVWETWSLQQDVAVHPRDVWIADALGGALDYEIGALSIPRGMNDTVSVRLGGEYAFDDVWQLRLGMYYENGAFDDAHLTALTVDSDKLVFSLGGSARVHEGLAFDVTVGYAYLFPRSVRNSVVPQTNPIRPPPAEGDQVFVGNGDYSFIAPFFGVGMRWNFDWTSAAATAPSEPAPEDASTSEAASDEGAVDPSQPWYRQGDAAPAPVVAPEPETAPEPAIVEEPEPEPRPRGRRRRRRDR